MSEFRNINRNHGRLQLLATVSATALFVAITAMHRAEADDGASDRPPFWIELGGQYSWIESKQDNFLPPFVLMTPRPSFETTSPLTVEERAPTSWDGNAEIAFEPEGTDWTISAAILYGRSSRSRHIVQLTQNPNTSTGIFCAYQNISAQSSEKHTILDFKAGKDVGLGMGLDSKLSFGVRFVQFNATQSGNFRSQPTNAIEPLHYSRFNADLNAYRKFNGVGPSLSWDASAALVGNRNNGEIAVDWGVNGAVLFGRQSIRGSQKTTGVPYVGGYTYDIYHHSPSLNRRKNVTVPNLGGFAGFSWQTSNAKVALGYRADFFFGAMDGGLDTRKAETIGFYGPFASVSVGLGG